MSTLYSKLSKIYAKVNVYKQMSIMESIFGSFSTFWNSSNIFFRFFAELWKQCFIDNNAPTSNCITFYSSICHSHFPLRPPFILRLFSYTFVTQHTEHKTYLVTLQMRYCTAEIIHKNFLFCICKYKKVYRIIWPFVIMIVPRWHDV